MFLMLCFMWARELFQVTHQLLVAKTLNEWIMHSLDCDAHCYNWRNVQNVKAHMMIQIFAVNIWNFGRVKIQNMAKRQVKRQGESERDVYSRTSIKQNASVCLAGSDQTTWNNISVEIAVISQQIIHTHKPLVLIFPFPPPLFRLFVQFLLLLLFQLYKTYSNGSISIFFSLRQCSSTKEDSNNNSELCCFSAPAFSTI